MRIVYPKNPQRSPMERLNTPWLALVALIGFIALCSHAYPNEPQSIGELVEQEMASYDSSKTRDYKPRPNKFDNTPAIVDIFGAGELVNADWYED